jgi:hypothetical protein
MISMDIGAVFCSLMFAPSIKVGFRSPSVHLLPSSLRENKMGANEHRRPFFQQARINHPDVFPAVKKQAKNHNKNDPI